MYPHVLRDSGGSCDGEVEGEGQSPCIFFTSVECRRLFGTISYARHEIRMSEVPYATALTSYKGRKFLSIVSLHSSRSPDLFATSR